ncbi:MAG: hypothetical protein AAB473_03125 [Patescibacteria group bacterium]
MPTPLYRLKSAELLVPGTTPEHLSVRTILLPLSQGQGSIFGLVDVTHRDSDARERLLHTIASHLEALRADIEKDGGNVPRRFEAMLVTMNADISRLATEKNILLKKTNILVGVMTNTQVFFSGIGTNHALFLHRTAERRYVVYELDAQLVTDESSPEKPLVTVLDGELHPGDVFYAARRIPPHALSLGDLQDILVTLPPQGALERIQQFVPPTAQFGGICFHVSEEEPLGPPKKANPMASISDLEETKSRTADLLGEQTPDVPQKLALGLASTKKFLATYSDSALWRGVKRAGRFIVSKIEQFFKQKSEGEMRTGTRLGGSNHRSRFGGVAGRIDSLRHAGITAVNGASRTTKVVGVGVAIVLVIVIMSIANRQAGQKNAEATVAYQSALTKIEEKRTAAEAAIIYGNTQEAQTLVTDATNLLATLPKDTTAQKTKADDLSRALQDLLGRTRGMETVTPAKVAELPAQFAFPLVGITSSGSALYGISADAAPWRVNEVSKAMERVDVGQSPAQNIIITAGEGDNMLTVDMDKRLWRTTVATPAITSLTSGIDGMASIEDVSAYNDNVYALSATSGQIVKMRPQGLGFEAGTPWVTAKTSDLSHAKALAIDGSLWVLTDTDVIVFKSGRETPWDHAKIDPAIVKPLDMWTDIDSKYLYILDGSDGRVVVMDKEKGGIVAQYVANLPGVVSFVVRESENRILLTTSTAVYSYTATHLLK